MYFFLGLHSLCKSFDDLKHVIEHHWQLSRKAMSCLQLSLNPAQLCRYYIRSALPFGSPVNTNFHLLRMVRCHGSRTDVLPLAVYNCAPCASGLQIFAESF